MKKILLPIMITTLLLMLCGSLNTFALTEGDWEFQLLDNEVMITGYLGEGGDVVIPETIYGAPVTKIEMSPHGGKDLRNATSVVFPSNIKTLNSNMFGTFYIINEILKTVVLPEGLEEIGWGTFSNCIKLKSVTLPKNLKVIGDGAFSGCTSVTEVVLPQSLSYIGDGAYSGSGLTELYLPYISELNYTHSDRWNMFAGCTQLKKVTLEQGIPCVPGGMFAGCTALEYVDLPNTITSINHGRNGAFEGCTSLKSIVLPTSLKTIDMEAFYGAPLEEVSLPYGTESIGQYAFAKCPTLKSLYLPDTVRSLASNALYKSDNCIVYCGKESLAAQQCKEYKISYLTDNSVNSEITVLYNDTRISFHAYGQNPELLNSRTLVPLRSVFEAMGADIKWDNATSTAIAKRNGVEVKIQIGANEIYKDGKAIPVDVPAMLLNDRTMVPVRVIAEAFGADVQWNGNGKTVLITE